MLYDEIFFFLNKILINLLLWDFIRCYKRISAVVKL